MKTTARARRFVGAVGRKIREERLALHLRQRDLARRLRTDEPVVSRIETGKKKLRLDELYEVAAALGKTAAEVVTVDLSNEAKARSNE